MMTRFAAAAALLLAASLMTATASGAEPGDTVTYNVDADGPLMLVSYHDEMDNLQQLTNQLAPWSTSFTSEATYGLFAEAQRRAASGYLARSSSTARSATRSPATADTAWPTARRW
jgi:hypothetical protein